MACRGFRDAGSQCGSRAQMVARAGPSSLGPATLRREGVEGVKVGGPCAKILPQGLGRTRRIRQRALSHRRTQVGKRTQRVAAGGSPRCLVGVTRQVGRGALEGLVDKARARPGSLQTSAMAIRRLPALEFGGDLKMAAAVFRWSSGCTSSDCSA
ncbi:hypothetical protein PSPO01_02000 [Paraphaeosphaeria sporulosa]